MIIVSYKPHCQKHKTRGGGGRRESGGGGGGGGGWGTRKQALLTDVSTHFICLIYCILVEFSTVICWTSPFIIGGCRVYFLTLFYFLWKLR